MQSWQEMYAARDWVALQNWWPHCEDQHARRAFFKRLVADVPKVLKANGLEELQQHARTKDAPDAWKGAALILELGELEASLTGPVPDPIEELSRERRRVTQELEALMQIDEPTEGSPELSQAGHIHQVFEQFRELDKIVAIATSEIDEDRLRPNDRRWVKMLIAEAFLCGFHTGAHARAALMKDFEKAAVSGARTLAGGQSGGRKKREVYKDRNGAIIARMERSIARGYSIAAAADGAFKAGLGTSAEANRKLYYRSRPKK